MTHAQAQLAASSAGRALLFHTSPNGGSFGGTLDTARAREIAPTLDGDALYDLLVETAKIASEEALREAAWQRHIIVERVRELAVKCDSLALYLFVQAEDERTKTL